MKLAAYYDTADDQKTLTEKRHVRRIAMLSLHTCPAALPGSFKTGGMNVYVRELSNELGRRGIQVDIFTRCQASCYKHLDQPLDESPNVRLIHIGAGPVRPVEPEALLPFVDDFTRGVMAFAAERAIDYDLIYAHYWLSGLAGLALRDAWHLPLIQMFHTLGLMKDRIGGQADGAPGVRSLSEARIMAEADRLIAATPAEQLQMTLLYDAAWNRIQIVPPGVDTDRFKPGTANDRKAAKVRIGFGPTDQLLLFIGRPEPLKAVDTILEALKIVFDTDLKQRESLRLLVIGGQGDEPTVQALIRQADAYGIGDRVCFLDAQPQEKLTQYFQAAEALLMPSDYESFGMAALEAMACGTPVIASQVGGLAYVVRDEETGYHVPTRDPEALAAAIQRLLNGPHERARLATNAALSSQHYQWARVADQLITVFDQC